MARELLDLPLAERRERLAAMMGDGMDEPLRARVVSLVLADERGGAEDAFAESNLGSSAGRMLVDAAAGGLPAIEGFRVLRVLGEGGMGVVYEAEQDRPRRRVAIKVMRGALTSPALRARFEYEAELLGRLRHPGIAGILSTGTFAPGGGESRQPFICMELVDGVPITEHAARERFGVREKLQLMIEVCEAVQHAHGRGIIHRDLKPGNLLVERPVTSPSQPSVEGLSRVRVLDFGVARLAGELAQALPGAVRTRTGEVVGTPTYMSPEQFLLRPSELDTRCDIYALGVTLYELLAGSPPHDLGDVPLGQIPTLLERQAPPPLTRRVPGLPGDVERVTSKAMATERERRYETASELAADLRRVLAGDPVLARPTGTWDRVVRAARRHPRVTGTVMGGAVMLVAGGAVAAYLAVETARARDAAQAEVGVTGEVIDFLSRDLLGSATPSIARGRELTVRELLDNASERVGGRFPRSPRSEAGVRSTIGMSYLGLGDAAKAKDHLERSLAIRVREDGPLSLAALTTELYLARAIELGGDLAAAVERKQSLLDRASQALGPNAELTITAMNDLADGFTKSRRYDEACSLLEQVVRRREEANGPSHLETLIAMNNLAAAKEGIGKVEDAGAVFVDLVAKGTESLGADHPDVLAWRNNLGWNLCMRSEAKRAEETLRPALADAERVLGPTHDLTLRIMGNLANAENQLGAFDDAERHLRAVFERSEASIGRDAVETIRHLVNLTGFIRQHRPPAEAIPYLEDIIDRASRAHAPDDPLQAYFLSRLGGTLLKTDRFAEADVPLRKAWELATQAERAGRRDEFGVLRDVPASMRLWCERTGNSEEAATWANR